MQTDRGSTQLEWRRGGREEGGRGDALQGNALPGGGSHPPFTAAAVIHTELPCGALVWAKHTFVPGNALQ